MYEMIRPIDLSADARVVLVQKRMLEDTDLQVVADLICEGLRDGQYTNLVGGKKRSSVIRFLWHLVTRCEIRHHDHLGRCVKKRTAALWVYTIEERVVGFGVLGQAFPQSIRSSSYLANEAEDRIGTDADHLPVVPGPRIRRGRERSGDSRLRNIAADDNNTPRIKNGVELLMLGVTPLQRGRGYGAAILDDLISELSHQYFELLVRCPTDIPLLFAMLATRGFVVLGRYCQFRVLRLFPSSPKSLINRIPGVSRYCE